MYRVAQVFVIARISYLCLIATEKHLPAILSIDLSLSSWPQVQLVQQISAWDIVDWVRYCLLELAMVARSETRHVELGAPAWPPLQRRELINGKGTVHTVPVAHLQWDQ